MKLVAGGVSVSAAGSVQSNPELHGDAYAACEGDERSRSKAAQHAFGEKGDDAKSETGAAVVDSDHTDLLPEERVVLPGPHVAVELQQMRAAEGAGADVFVEMDGLTEEEVDGGEDGHFKALNDAVFGIRNAWAGLVCWSFEMQLDATK